MAEAAVSSEETFDDLSGRGRVDTAGFEFAPRRFDGLDEFYAAMFREAMLENFHERFLFFDGQAIGGIQNLRKLCHGQNLAPHPTLGNDVFFTAFGTRMQLQQTGSRYALKVTMKSRALM